MSRTPSNARINASPAKLSRAPRSKRLPAPNAKVRENQALRRTRRGTRAQSPPPLQFQDIEDSDGEYEEENEDTANTLEDLLGLVKDLKETIDQQNRSIQEAHAELKELKEEQQQVREQNDGLKNEICALRDEVNTLSTSLPSTRSWGSIAANGVKAGSTPLGRNGALDAHNLARYVPHLPAMMDRLYCTIDTSRVASEDADKTSPGPIRTTVEKEIRTTEGRCNWRC